MRPLVQSLLESAAGVRRMREAPALQEHAIVSPPTPRYALLIMPVYAKDPHGSFGKHVLTPLRASTPDRVIESVHQRLLSLCAVSPPEVLQAFG